MKNISKTLQKIFKQFFYNLFKLIYGEINGIKSFKEDSRIETLKSNFQDNINYTIYKIQNGRLYTDRVQDTAIILDDNIIEGPSFQLRPVNNVEVFKNVVLRKGTPRFKKKLRGITLSLLTGGAGNDNYFHWLFDVLPRIKICENVFDISNIDYFLLPDVQLKYQIQTLDKLKIPYEKRLTSRKFRHIISDEIIVTQHPYCLKNDASREIENIPTWISKWLKSSLLDKSDSSINNYPSKIYIDRKDSVSNNKKLRSILNENEVKNLLKKNDFTILSLGEYSFDEQAKIMNNAKLIVGLHGAGFANFCFCKPETRVVELKSTTSGNMYKNLALTNKLDYTSISSEPIGINYNNQYGHIKVSIQDLEKKIL
mgnify:CR=1 FL=1